MDVCLVQMPYADLWRPSIALGLLKSYLVSRGIGARVLHANFDFVDDVGLDVYLSIADTPAQSLVGEWTFAMAAFPEAELDDHEFLGSFEQHIAKLDCLRSLIKLHEPLDLRKLLVTIRERARAFIERTARKILALGPRIVGCTSMFQQHTASLALLRRVKELDPTVITMIGGANCEGTMGEATHRECPWVDFVASGEADAYFGDLCRAILDRGPDLEARDLPGGVFAPRTRGRLRLAGKAARAILHSLDGAATPDYDDYFDDLAAASCGAHLRPSLPFESSRGCWWGMKHHCTFCGLNGEGMSFRAKSADRLLEEIATLRKRYGVSSLEATDNIMDNKYLSTVLPRLAAEPEPPFFFYEVKANLKREQLRLFGSAGVRAIQPGIESLHDDVLRLLDKGNGLFINVQLLRWAQEFGITVAWNFLAGAPGENEEWYREIAEWVPLLTHLEPPSGRLAKIRYDRFSVYFESPERFGIHLEPYRAYRQVYPWSERSIRDFAYYFEDLNGVAPLVGEGYEAVNRELEKWARAFAGQDRAPARLLAEDLGDRAIVRDTRPVAVSAEMVLDGLDYAVWKQCDSSTTVEALGKPAGLSGRQASESEIRDAVQRLIDRKLLLAWRGRVVSLSVAAPAVPYLDVKTHSKYIDLGKLLARQARSSAARSCPRLPGDTPLAELLADR